MKKVCEVIKKVFIWLGAVFVAIFTVLFVKERAVVSIGSTTEKSWEWYRSEDLNQSASFLQAFCVKKCFCAKNIS